MPSQKLVKISELSVPEKKDSDMLDHLSTELSHNLWLKVVTLLNKTEPVENLSMVKNSRMKTLKLNIKEKELFLWLMPDQTLMDLNSFYVSLKLIG